MLGLNNRIKDLAGNGKSINVGIIGLGQMGLSLVSHLSNIDGFRVCGVADINANKTDILCRNLNTDRENIFIFESKKVQPENKGQVSSVFLKQFASSVFKLDDIFKNFNKLKSFLNFDGRQIAVINSEVGKNKIVYTDDFAVLALIDEIDVVVDATGYPEVGAEAAFISLIGDKDVVTLNVETDVIIGPVLKKIAASRDLVYTLSAGDEPAALKELYDFADGLGFKIICAGKGKNNPLDVHANPSSVADYAVKKGSSARMMTSFIDGTKSMIEMACMSNATGLIPDCRGMYGPKINIKDIASTLCHKKDGGILKQEGVVDFVIGDLAPGVFLVYSTKNDTIKEVIRYLNMGNGPNYLIYKPYHLTSIETPLSIALVYFERQPWIVPKNGGLVSEVIAMAKKDLKAGEVLDGIGGYSVYGSIDLYKNAKELNCLPVGLSKGCILKKDIEKDSLILYKDVEFPYGSLLLTLRKIQDNEIQQNQ